MSGSFALTPNLSAKSGSLEKVSLHVSVVAVNGVVNFGGASSVPLSAAYADDVANVQNTTVPILNTVASLLRVIADGGQHDGLP